MNDYSNYGLNHFFIKYGLPITELNIKIIEESNIEDELSVHTDLTPNSYNAIDILNKENCNTCIESIFQYIGKILSTDARMNNNNIDFFEEILFNHIMLFYKNGGKNN